MSNMDGTTPPPSDTPLEDAAEVEAWRNVDPNDPQAVARALAALGMRVGAKMSVVEHMHARIGRAVDAVEKANETLGQLVTSEQLEARVAELEAQVADDRRHDRQRAARRFVGLVVVFGLFAAVVLSAIVLNRLDIERSQEADRRFAVRSEAVAICASTYPGDEPRIRECVETRLPSSP